MTQAAQKVDTTAVGGRRAVRKYPNNKLGPQVREFRDAFSGFAMLRSVVRIPA